MGHLIEVAFRGNRKEFFSWDGDAPPPLRAGVIVEADRGEDFGRVHATGELAEVRCKGCAHGCGTAPPPRQALRLATADDERLDRELTAENERARRTSMERVKANGLVMKLTDAEWQWDRRKLTLYFTADRRVDFRGLVRDLAALFKSRIELKQIGVRDEAKRLGGVGRCGREYCSASWLPDLRPVNLGVAKDQKLSLNPQQISGACGRLMCCLRYEHEFYVQSRRRFPKEGKILVTTRGEEKVVACDIFNERVTLRTVDGDTRVVALAELKAEMGGAEHGGGAEERTLESSTAEYAVETVVAVAELEPQSMSMLDTMEFEAFTVAQAVEGEAEVEVEVEVEAEVEAEVAVETPMEAAAVDSAATEGAPKRKRRRGRRGGRRLRAAEERRKAGDEPHDSDDSDDSDPADDSHTDDDGV
ncbi:regulatory iron-sulfur-containing complex subunit RicT [Gemmatimonas sp.]|uniref:PSP1 domain-containing protein n=1 Tax=Gemmatimonas sp. TaxID=1962908 RepID=UPI0022BB0C35|nr:regulatory iron-sulfur-containing complex subunit RicT [Gemmatimonas sp.]MCZ8205269.1 regulatory iron-sulfur-containing complex subunit RicT [Gemmatimonas sp.]